MRYFNGMGSCLAAAIMFLTAPAAMAQTYNPAAPSAMGQTYSPAAPKPAESDPAASPTTEQDGEETVKLNPELDDLPDDEGAEETYYQCITCHSIAIVKQQRLSDARWDYLWDWMVEDQGMYEPDEETKEIIMTYLKKHFSSER